MRKCEKCGVEGKRVATTSIADTTWGYCTACGFSEEYPGQKVVGIDDNGLPIFSGELCVCRSCGWEEPMYEFKNSEGKLECPDCGSKRIIVK